MLRSTYKAMRRVLILVVGISIVVVGVIMIVTPGPAIIVIPAGLALLATEFLWARRLLDRLKASITNRTGNKKTPTTGSASDSPIQSDPKT